jgi:L-ascorbate metabolism protein UlaG (beta-lactamase superfamily)
VLANGETKTVAGISIEAVAAYDLIPGDPFHPKGRGNSYIITLGGQRLYFSGVGECVPEVQALKGIDIAFLSMNLPHGRMTPAAAAECVTIFKPRVVYPYHYRDGKVEDFKDDLKGEPVDVRLAKWYPSATGK